jgi:hypothetical protein
MANKPVLFKSAKRPSIFSTSASDLDGSLRLGDKPLPIRPETIDERIQTVANKYGYGPDDPIPWDSFGTSERPPTPPPTQPLLAPTNVLAPVVNPVYGAIKASPERIKEFLDELLALGIRNGRYDGKTK